MPYATYRFNKIIAAETIRFIVTVAIVVYKGLKLVVYRMLTKKTQEVGLQSILRECTGCIFLRLPEPFVNEQSQCAITSYIASSAKTVHGNV